MNAVKPMVINPTVAERGLESFCPTSKQNVAVCNESQKQPPPSQNGSNAGSVRVNINLDANLAQTQNEITVRFSSRITGNGNNDNTAMSNDNKVPNNVNLTGDYNGIQHPCKAESNDLSFCDSSEDFDKLLNSVTVDEDIPIDFEFLNGLDDSNEFLPLNSSLPPSTEISLSPCSNNNNNNIMSQQHTAVVPNQGIIPQQKSTFPNQATPGHPLAPNFSRIELNISSDMSKFSSILGETPGPAAETLKHLAAKHISQEKVQQKMIHGPDMYPMKTFSPRACYPMQHMQPVNSSFGNDPNGNVMMGGGNFRLPYPASQGLNFDCQSNVTIDTMKVKTPPCYQDKTMFPHQMQVQQPSMQFVGQKLNIASTVKEGDVNLEMKYDFEQCRLSQDSQASVGIMPQSQGMGKAYPNRIMAQTNSVQVDCFRMQQQKSYQRYQPYSLQGHPRFSNSVPSAFIQSQSDSGAGMYENMTYGMGMNGRQPQVCMQQQQSFGPFKQNSMAMVSPMQARHNAPCVKDAASMDDFKSGSTGMTEMIPSRYPSMNMAADNSVCHSSMNSQTIQMNSPDMFYNDAHQTAYQNFSPMVPTTQLRGKWNNTAFPAGHHPMAGKHGAVTPHMQVGYQEINQPVPQNCFPDNRNYTLSGTNSNAAYQFHCNNVQQASQYFPQNLQDGVRMMHYNRSGLQQTVHLQPGLSAGYNPNLKRPAQNMMHPQTRMENFSYGY